MKIVLAPNAFKESLTAGQAARAMRCGLSRALPEAELIELPVADGGDGTGEVLLGALGGRITRHRVTGPLGKPVRARLIELHGSGPATWVVEMAEAAGLKLVPREKRNPLTATTAGVGELIDIARRLGAKRIIVGLGGSATVDGGAGMAAAMGFRLLDKRDRPIGRGPLELSKLASIEAPEEWRRNRGPKRGPVEIVAACDVTNRLLGAKGTAPIYGPQKGATAAMIPRIEAGLRNLAYRLERDLGSRVKRAEGSGAAGGLGAGLLGFLGAELKRGAELVLETVGFDSALRGADWVITGEGRLDLQTLENKAPAAVARMAALRGVPTVALAGEVAPELSRSSRSTRRGPFVACLPIVAGPIDRRRAMAEAARLIEAAAYQLGGILDARGRSGSHKRY